MAGHNIPAAALQLLLQYELAGDPVLEAAAVLAERHLRRRQEEDEEEERPRSPVRDRNHAEAIVPQYSREDLRAHRESAEVGMTPQLTLQAMEERSLQLLRQQELTLERHSSLQTTLQEYLQPLRLQEPTSPASPSPSTQPSSPVSQLPSPGTVMPPHSSLSRGTKRRRDAEDEETARELQLLRETARAQEVTLQAATQDIVNRQKQAEQHTTQCLQTMENIRKEIQVSNTLLQDIVSLLKETQ